jgi:DNA topoisomerase IA
VPRKDLPRCYLQERGALSRSCKVERITFTAITADAVREAIQQPRDISQDLVNAYFARLSMDYLLGFHMSPVLWRKLPGSKSAGRVQSPALRLLCDRETERDLFKPEHYYSMTAALVPEGSKVKVLGHSLQRLPTTFSTCVPKNMAYVSISHMPGLLHALSGGMPWHLVLVIGLAKALA